MGKTTPAHKIRAVNKDLATNRYNISEIAKRNDVGYTVALRLHAIFMCRPKTQEVSMMYNGKTEAYQTEDQALSCPLYNATNKELITPIRKDWKLY